PTAQVVPFVTDRRCRIGPRVVEAITGDQLAWVSPPIIALHRLLVTVEHELRRGRRQASAFDALPGDGLPLHGAECRLRERDHHVDRMRCLLLGDAPATRGLDGYGLHDGLPQAVETPRGWRIAKEK